jgi:hypothetical protein
MFVSYLRLLEQMQAECASRTKVKYLLVSVVCSTNIIDIGACKYGLIKPEGAAR